MTPHIPEEFSTRLIDWSPFVIMGNTMPPRDPDEDEEDEDEEDEEGGEEAVAPGEQISLQHALQRRLGEHLHHAAVARELGEGVRKNV